MKTTTLLKNCAFACVFLLSFNVFSQNPGNVSSDLQLWMKANSGTNTTTDGAAVSSWSDNSPNGFTATTGASNNPTYRTNVINFNPAVEFNSSRSQKKYLKIPTASVSGTGLDITPSPASPTVAKRSSMSIFAAFLTDGSGAGTMFSRATSSSRSYQLWLGDRDRVVHYTLGRTSGTSQSDPNSGINYGIVHARNDAKISSVTIDINTSMANDPNTDKILRYVNGYLDPLTVHTDGDAGFGTGETTNMDVLIGARRNSNNSDSGNELIGNVAELIVYNRALSASERVKVETYLAIKYGITLGYNDEFYRWENNPNTTTTFGYSGTSNDFVLSNGTTVWDGSANAGFGYNVFGIARDDNSGLLQLKSKSVHVEQVTKDTSVITMEDESNSIANDRSYLLLGNNGDKVELQSSSVPERVSQTIGRIWKAREGSNDVGTVKLDFDLSQYSISGASDLELIVSSESSLTNYKNYTGTYNASTKTASFTGVDFNDGDYFTLAKLEEVQGDNHFYFNGTDSYVDLGDKLDLTGSFTVSAWINREAGTTSASILSKRNTAASAGFDFQIFSSKLRMYWRDSGGSIVSVISTVNIPAGKWHHVAAIYNGSTISLYIDGEFNKSISAASPVNTSESFMIGAAGTGSPSKFFGGNIDEVRVWNSALSVDELRFIMNQEIENNSGIVIGSYFKNRNITPTKNDISSLSWTNLKGYFPFTRIRGNCLFNYSSNTSDNGRTYNTPNIHIENQTAPLPYKSVSNGNWSDSSTWLNGSVQNIPATKAEAKSTESVDWNIVELSHNVTINSETDLPSGNKGNRNLLALFVDSNTLTLDGDTSLGTGYGITVTHYLDLDGNIDLNGESQLIQTEDSDLNVTSAGKIFRDQQGTSDVYTYNYWSSPVGVSNTTSNNNDYTLPNVMRDGNQNIDFITNGYDGTNTSPIGIADYWIWKFANQLDDDYSAWQHVRSTGTMKIGEGFTMKGPGTGGITDEQNYVFTGKPNNGEITLPLTAGNDYLVGNPYASAIDAHQFILDNGPTIEGAGNTTGTLYFWEHWGGGSHNLDEYQGGYATYNLAGGVPAAVKGVADPDVDQSSLIGTKTPGRYIPVSQGFFVIGEATGTIKFNNGQRVYQKEAASSVFMEANNPDAVIGKGKSADNDEDADLRRKIRLGFNSNKYMHRQLLVTEDLNATEGIDWGYDGLLYDDQIDDLYWMIEDSKHVIQGINVITTETILPLGLHVGSDGLSSITIEGTENVDNDLEIYLHDKVLDIYHDLKLGEYTVDLVAGDYLDRFELTFSTGDSLGVTEQEFNLFDVNYNNDIEKVVVNNPTNKQIMNLEVFNILGQSIFYLDELTSDSRQEIEIGALSTGTYIINVNTPEGKISKKVLIK